MRIRVLFLGLLISGAVISGLACPPCPPEHGGGNPYNSFFTITVSPDLEMTVIPPVFLITDVEYPGVSAERISKQVDVVPDCVSQDGQKVSFSVKNTGSKTFSCLWLVIKRVDSWVNLSSLPDAINRRDEPIFVFGPLDPDSQGMIELEFDTGEFEKSYTFQFDVLSISPRLVFTANPYDLHQDTLFSTDSPGNDLFRITREFRRNIDAAWAPGNEVLAFANFEKNGTFQIYTVHPDGSHLNRVTRDTPDRSAFCPSFSPDGKHIVYGCDNRSSGSSRGICINSVLGDDEREIVSGQGQFQNQVFRPSWSPDGTKILYFARHPVKYGRFYFFVQEINPETLELQGEPVQVNEVYDGDTLYPDDPPYENEIYLPDGLSPIHWAPDSRHGVLTGQFWYISKETEASNWGWQLTYQGPVILDLAKMIDDGPRVYPGHYATLLNSFDFKAGLSPNSSFSPQADRLTYRRDLPDKSDAIVYLSLDPDYQPISLDEHLFLERECVIMAPNWPPRLLPGFYR